MNTLRQMALVGRGVGLEVSRRRDVNVLALLMSLFVVGALAVRVVGVDKPSVGTFLLNLGLSVAYYGAHVLTLLLAAGQIPNELENRTLYPLLAKPVGRSTVLLGKWGACVLAGSGVFYVLALAGWVAAPKMEAYDAVLLLQLLALMPFSIALLAALALLLSLYWTRGISLVVLGLLLLAGDHVLDFLERLLPAAWRVPAEWVQAYLPNFAKLDLITRYTDGIGPLSLPLWLGLMLHATLFIVASLLLAVRGFERRPL